MPGVTGGLSGDRIWSQEPWAAERQDEMNGAAVNGENREFSSGQPRLATFCGARPGDRDTGRERAWPSELILRSSVQDPKLDSYTEQQTRGKCPSDAGGSQTRSEAKPPEEGAGPGRGQPQGAPG